MFDEDELLPLSGLQHIEFCERRAALVCVEGLWDDNLLTIEGRVLHERTHEPATETRGDLRIARSLWLRSLRLGLSCKADVVEFHRVVEVGGSSQRELGAVLPGITGRWRPYPVEYKRGRRRHDRGYEVQLCAQALCLEEMLDVSVTEGALFYGKSGRRLEVAFDADLRSATEDAAMRLHRLVRAGKTPSARYEKKCDECSLLSLCLPSVVGARRSARTYLDNALSEMHGDLP